MCVYMYMPQHGICNMVVTCADKCCTRCNRQAYKNNSAAQIEVGRIRLHSAIAQVSCVLSLLACCLIAVGHLI